MAVASSSIARIVVTPPRSNSSTPSRANTIRSWVVTKARIGKNIVGVGVAPTSSAIPRNNTNPR